MKLSKYFGVLLFIGLITSTAIAQSVNDKVDKNNINETFLKSLIIERINEIRTYKKAPELEANEILKLAAQNQADYNAKNHGSSKEQSDATTASTADRVKLYGGQKKGKVVENISAIDMEGRMSYMDLSDDITSQWLADKDATKAIENAKNKYEGFAFALDKETNMLYISHVYGDENVGTTVVMPKVEEEKPAEEAAPATADATPAATETATPTETPATDTPAETTEAAGATPETPAKEEPAATEETVADAAPAKEEAPAAPAPEIKTQVDETPQPIASTPGEAPVELPACISEKKFAKLQKIAFVGIMYSGKAIYIKEKYLNLLAEVVTADMDGIVLEVEQLDPYQDGPNTFDYSLLNEDKLYKNVLFTNMKSDLLLKEMPNDPIGYYSFKLRYIRKGIDCYSEPITLRSVDFDEASLNPVPEEPLTLIFDAEVSADKSNKKFKHHKIKIPFLKGKSNWTAEDMITILDTLVEPNFKINSVVVTAHSSVEGDSLLNKNLAEKRARNIVGALKNVNKGQLFYGQIQTNDSWDDFYEKVGESAHPELADQSRDEVRKQLRPGMEKTKALEGLLSDQRYAVLDLYLEYETEDTGDDLKEIRNIYYDFGKWYVRKEAGKSLDMFSILLKKRPEYSLIEIGSHTDSRGSYAFNEKLSEKRAGAVVDYLISKGIDRGRLVPKGYGESELLNNCKDGVECTESEHQRNRRTTFRILDNANEINSVEPDDIVVDYAPSFEPKDGLIDIAAELDQELENENIDGAIRVQTKMIQKALRNQLSPEFLLQNEFEWTAENTTLITNQLVAQELFFAETTDKNVLMKDLDKLLAMASSDPYAIYNNLAFKLLYDKNFTEALRANPEKLNMVKAIVQTLYKSKVPTKSIDIISAQVNMIN